MHQIRAIALDVDGPNGEEFKRFSFADVMGVSLARKAGLLVTLISGEESALVDRYAQKMGLTDVAKGCKDKAQALRAFAERNALELREIAFMGDDVNDVAAMAIACRSFPVGRAPFATSSTRSWRHEPHSTPSRARNW